MHSAGNNKPWWETRVLICILGVIINIINSFYFNVTIITNKLGQGGTKDFETYVMLQKNPPVWNIAQVTSQICTRVNSFVDERGVFLKALSEEGSGLPL